MIIQADSQTVRPKLQLARAALSIGMGARAKITVDGAKVETPTRDEDAFTLPDIAS